MGFFEDPKRKKIGLSVVVLLLALAGIEAPGLVEMLQDETPAPAPVVQPAATEDPGSDQGDDPSGNAAGSESGEPSGATPGAAVDDPAQDPSSNAGSSTTEPEIPQSNLTFKNNSRLEEHYEKHGIEMGFDSPEAYLAAANAVVSNPDALFKYEAEDGDEVYYIPSTDEIVFVSQQGYIRTYFICSGRDYFDRQ